MPDLAAHYFASYIVAKHFYRKRLAIFIAFLGLVPDIDALLRMHRWVTHSLISLLIAVTIYAILRFVKPRARITKLFLVFSTLYALHLAMDIFTAPLPLLWPFTNEGIGIELSIVGYIPMEGMPHLEMSTRLIISITRFVPHTIEGPVLSLVGVSLGLTCLFTEVMSLTKHSHSNPSKERR